MTKTTCWICKQTFEPGERIIRGATPRHAADSERCKVFVAGPETPEKLRPAPRRISGEPPGWEGTRALHERLVARFNDNTQVS